MKQAFSTRVYIAAPVTKVWGAMTVWQRALDWMGSVDRVEPLAGAEPGPGVPLEVVARDPTPDEMDGCRSAGGVEAAGLGRGRVKIAGVVLVAVLLGLGTPEAVSGQDHAAAFEAFGALVVGEWEAEDARHVFRWGVGRRLIHAASYFIGDDGWKLVSEGIWYWDSETSKIRSVQVAIGMPVERFEYESQVQGDRVVHDLRAFGPESGRFVEVWLFGEEGYDWWLEAPANPGRRLMGGSFRRSGRTEGQSRE